MMEFFRYSYKTRAPEVAEKAAEAPAEEVAQEKIDTVVEEAPEEAPAASEDKAYEQPASYYYRFY